MTISLSPEAEAIARRRAEAEGLSIAQYLERLLNAELAAERELESLALESLQSGDPLEAPLEYWIDQHRRLDERIKQRLPAEHGKTAL